MIMKKIFLALLMVGALVTSCDMDKKPYGSLDNDTAIQNLNDCRRFRNGLYSSMRSLTTGGYVNYPGTRWICSMELVITETVSVSSLTEI